MPSSVGLYLPAENSVGDSHFSDTMSSPKTEKKDKKRTSFMHAHVCFKCIQIKSDTNVRKTLCCYCLLVLGMLFDDQLQ